MFIAIEGIEGSGKSSLCNSLAVRIKEQTSKEVVLTREPGSSPLGIELRKLLLNRENHKVCSTAELFMFAADRAQHVEELIKPALSRDAVVICDRFIHSTVAYQGYGRGIDIELLDQINAVATNGLQPDIVLLLDLPAETGLSRAQARGEEEWTSFEDEELSFHRRIRDGFLKLAENHANHIKTIDATSSQTEILEQACSILFENKNVSMGV